MADEAPQNEDLRMQVIGYQGMISELQAHVSKLSGRAGELSGMLRQKDAELTDMRTQLIKQGELLAAKLSANGKDKSPPVDKDHALGG